MLKNEELIGKKVKIICYYWGIGSHCFEIGEIVEIVQYDKTNCFCYLAKNEEGEEHWICDEEFKEFKEIEEGELIQWFKRSLIGYDKITNQPIFSDKTKI